MGTPERDMTIAIPVTPVEVFHENMIHSMNRGITKRMTPFNPHAGTLVVVGGGPSLEDTWSQIDEEDVVVSINGTHDFLINRGVTPWAAGFVDPSPEIAREVTPKEGVHYFVASTCHKDLFDKLEGYTVILWHPSGVPGGRELVERHDGVDAILIGGGTTMGTRWINLGNLMGFSRFSLHGFDSSFREDRSHAYPHHIDHKGGTVIVEGYKTRPNYMAQVADFFAIIERYEESDLPDLEITMHGDGLLQHFWRRYEDADSSDSQLS